MHLLCACMCMHLHKKRKKSKLYCNTFHLPPLGLLCDHPELSYWYTPFVGLRCMRTAHVGACSGVIYFFPSCLFIYQLISTIKYILFTIFNNILKYKPCYYYLNTLCHSSKKFIYSSKKLIHTSKKLIHSSKQCYTVNCGLCGVVLRAELIVKSTL